MSIEKTINKYSITAGIITNACFWSYYVSNYYPENFGSDSIVGLISIPLFYIPYKIFEKGIKYKEKI